MPTITRLYHFEAAHFLPNVPEGHRCKRMHGHNYEFEVSAYANSLDHAGFVIDFWDLDKIVQPMIDRLDHRTLNEIPGLENPTAEIIAFWILNTLDRSQSFKITSVRLWETKTCSAIATEYEA